MCRFTRLHFFLATEMQLATISATSAANYKVRVPHCPCTSLPDKYGALLSLHELTRQVQSPYTA